MTEELESELRQIVRSHVAGGTDPDEVATVLESIQADVEAMQEVGL